MGYLLDYNQGIALLIAMCALVYVVYKLWNIISPIKEE